jgi:DNA recombination-dependent growth factor C
MLTILQFRTTVLDLICDLPRSFSIADESAIKAQIISALHQRGFSRVRSIHTIISEVNFLTPVSASHTAQIDYLSAITSSRF